MLKKHSQLFEGLFVVADLLVVSCAWAFSYWLRFHTDVFPVEKGIPLFSNYLKMLVFVIAVWPFVFKRFGLYKPRRGTSRINELWQVTKANSLSVLLVLSATFLFWEKSVPFSRLVFLIFLISSTISTLLVRSVIRGALRFFRKKGYNLRYILIVGSGELAEQVSKRLLKHPEFGYELLGCLASDEEYRILLSAENEAQHQTKAVSNLSYRQSSGSAFGYAGGSSFTQPVDLRVIGGGKESKLPVIGSYSDLEKYLAAGGIDQLIVALPFSDNDKLKSVISTIGDSIVDVKIVPDFHQFIQLGSLVEDMEGLPVMSLASTPLVGYNRIAKRIFDIIFGSFFLIILSPLMIVTALLVKLTSRGPVFFLQERVGLDGTKFHIYKFRTMKVDAEQNGAQFAVNNDPRTTLIGGALRKLNIDELPQLINVISGKMSLVGPRPERSVFIEQFRKHIPRYMLRHKVQAGMTGWAQVNGWRGNTSIARRIEHDLYYIENWSLSFDLKIIALTLFKSFRDRNAY
jgi:Undecaprenyl-phosphate glucose phosphotransferase